MLEIGIKGKLEIAVTNNLSAQAMGSGTLHVFATPAMVALMEETAWRSVQEYLDTGEGTVGISLQIQHVAATPIGMRVYCESELIAAEGRKLSFALKVYDERGLVGEGTHERFIVNNEKFQQKTNEK